MGNILTCPCGPMTSLLRQCDYQSFQQPTEVKSCSTLTTQPQYCNLLQNQFRSEQFIGKGGVISLITSLGLISSCTNIYYIAPQHPIVQQNTSLYQLYNSRCLISQYRDIRSYRGWRQWGLSIGLCTCFYSICK